MELIKALEQLSLEVRNQSFKSNDQKATHSMQDRQQFYHQHAGWSLSAEGQNQLLDFDNSIDTLLNQITDLNCPNPISIHHDVSAKRANFRRPYHLGGSSLETSQEEDSDCSSQQSESKQNNQSVDVNPFVRDLLKRDLGSITETVRKIGQILILGKEIEFIYNSLDHRYTTNLLPENFIHQKVQPKINLDVASSKCAKFTRLCQGETHIMNLPTVVRYQDYRDKLLIELDSLINNQQLTGQLLDCNQDDEMDLSDEGGDDADEEDVSSDDLAADIGDAAYLRDCDQNRVANWTENKLYVNHQHPSTSNNWQ